MRSRMHRLNRIKKIVNSRPKKKEIKEKYSVLRIRRSPFGTEMRNIKTFKTKDEANKYIISNLNDSSVIKCGLI